MNVVLTREAGRNDGLRAWLPPKTTVTEVPLTTTRYFDLVDVRVALDAAPLSGTYQTLVVTSWRSVSYVEAALRASANDVEVYCVGPTTASALADRGLHVHARGEGSAKDLAPEISRGPVLMLGAKAMRDELAAALRAKGLDVALVACYETIERALDPSAVEALHRADVLFIGAPSAWAVARRYVANTTWVVVPGASTGAAVRADHPRVIEGWGPQLRAHLDTLAR